MANEINTAERTYRDLFSYKDFVLSVLAPYYFPDEEVSTLNIGTIGFVTEQIGTVTEDTFFTISTLIKEMFPQKAQLPESIYSHASHFQLSNVLSSAAACKFLLVFEEETIVQLMEDVKQMDGIKENIIYIDRDTQIIVEDKVFTLDYDIEIMMKVINGETVYTAKYITTDFKNSVSSITDPYIKVRKSVDNYLALEVIAHQCTREVVSDNIIDNSVINHPTIEIPFSGKLAGFDVFYKTPKEEEFNTQLKVRVIESLPIDDPFCYYRIKDEGILELSFTTIESYFQPEFNSDIEVVLYMTDGEKGNFNVYTGSNIDVICTNEKYWYNNNMVLAAKPVTASEGGSEALSLDALQELTVEQFSTANALTTDPDLETFFRNYRYRYDNNIKFIKRRDDVCERLFAGYLIMRDDDYIYPTNTMDMSLNYLDLNNPSEGYIYSLDPGALFKYETGLTDRVVPVLKNDYRITKNAYFMIYDNDMIMKYFEKNYNEDETLKETYESFDDFILAYVDKKEEFNDTYEWTRYNSYVEWYVKERKTEFLLEYLEKHKNIYSNYIGNEDEFVKGMLDEESTVLVFPEGDYEDWLENLYYYKDHNKNETLREFINKYRYLCHYWETTHENEDSFAHDYETADDYALSVSYGEEKYSKLEYSQWEDTEKKYVTIYDDEIFELEKKHPDEFYFSCPFLMTLTTKPNIFSYYSTIVDKYSLVDFVDYNNESFLQFIMNQIHVTRELTQEKKYKFSATILPSISWDSEKLVPSYYGTATNNKSNPLRMILTINDKSGNECCYIELLPEKVSEDEQITFTGELYTNDHLTTSGSFTILANAKSKTPVHFMGANDESRVIPMEDVVLNIYTLYSDPETDAELKETNNSFYTMDESLVGYVWTNKFNTYSDPVTFIKPLNMVRSNIYFRDDRNYNIDTGDVYIYSVPFMKYDILVHKKENGEENTKQAERFKKFITQYTQQYLNMETVLNTTLRNTSHIDLKFYNTYGKSRNYLIGENNEIIDKVNISIYFDVCVLRGTDLIAKSKELKTYIKNCIETINSLGSNDFYISNLIRKIENDHSFVDHLHFKGINGYNTDYQNIKNITKDLDDLNAKERYKYVPEMLVCNTEDIHLTMTEVD